MIGTKSGIIVPDNGHMESAIRRGSAAFDRWLRVPRVDLLRGRGEDSTYEVDKLWRGAVVVLPLLRNLRARRTRHASSASHAPLSLVRPSAIARIVERDILAAASLAALTICITYCNSTFTFRCRDGLEGLRGARPADFVGHESPPSSSFSKPIGWLSPVVHGRSRSCCSFMRC